MIPFLSTGRLLAGGVVLAGLAGAVLWFGHVQRDVGRAEIQAEWDRDRTAWQASYDAQASESARTEAAWAGKLQEIEDGLQAKLSTAESSVAGLARRLRLAARGAGQCAVPGDTSAAGGTGEASGVSGGLEQLEQRAWQAAAADSARLTACQQAYNSLLQ